MVAVYNEVRPAVLDMITATQLAELYRQFDDDDREQFNKLVESYGWEPEDADRLWEFIVAGDLQRFEHDIP
jgi:hypothetical protein